MTESNVSTRSHRKNGNNGKKKEQSITTSETPATSGDKTIPQNAFLPEFSTEQTQSLSTFINEIIQTTNVSLKIEIFENLTTLQAAIANLGNPFKPTGSNSLNPEPHRDPVQESIFGDAFYQSNFPTRNFSAR